MPLVCFVVKQETAEKESELFASLELTCDPVLELEFHPTVLMSEMRILIAFLKFRNSNNCDCVSGKKLTVIADQ